MLRNGTLTSATNPFIVSGGSSLATLGGAASLTKTGNGVFYLASPNNNTYSGGTLVQSGTLNFTPGGVGTAGDITFGMYTDPDTLITTSSRGVLQYSNINVVPHADDPAVDDLSARIPLNQPVIIDTNGNSITFAHNFKSVAGGDVSGSLTKLGHDELDASSNVLTDVLKINAALTYIGGTTIAGGMLQMGGNNYLSTIGDILVTTSAARSYSAAGTSSSVTTIGTLDLGGYSQTTAGLITMRGGVLQNGILTSSVYDFNAQSGTATVSLRGSVGLTKSGAGTLRLDPRGAPGGTNPYTGQTQILQGGLSVPDAAALGTMNSVLLNNGMGYYALTPTSAPTSNAANNATLQIDNGSGDAVNFNKNITLAPNAGGNISVSNSNDVVTFGMTLSGGGGLVVNDSVTNVHTYISPTASISGNGVLSLVGNISPAPGTHFAVGGTTTVGALGGGGNVVTSSNARISISGVVNGQYQGTGGASSAIRGSAAGNATLTITENSQFNTDSDLYISEPVYEGGTSAVVVSGNGILAVGGSLSLGKGIGGGVSSLTIGDGSESGNARVTAGMVGIVSAASSSILSLNTGGVLTTAGIQRPVTGANATIDFNGGTLKVSGPSKFLSTYGGANIGGTFLSGLTNAYVEQNGAIIDTNGFNITISQNLVQGTDGSNSGHLDKYGVGMLTLSGNNNYGGGTNLYGGTLYFSNLTSMGANGSVMLNTGDVADGSKIVVSGPQVDQRFIAKINPASHASVIALSADTPAALDLTQFANAQEGIGPELMPSLGALSNVTLSGPLTVTNTYNLGGGGGRLTVSSRLTDAVAGETKTGYVAINGNVWLNNTTNNYSGGTQINNGVLRISHATVSGAPVSSLSRSGITTMAGGVLEITGTNVFARRLGIDPDTSVLNQVNLTGIAGFSAYGQPVTISLGSITSPTAITWGTTDGFAPSTLVLNEYTANAPLIFANALNLGSGTRKIAVNSSADNPATLTGVISNSGKLQKTGSGTLILANAGNTFTGGVSLDEGVVQVNAARNLGNGNTPLTFNGGTLRVLGTTFTDLSGRTLNTTNFKGALDIVESANSFFLGQNLTGSSAVTKLGAGTLYLSGVNSYSGDTNILGGTLKGSVPTGSGKGNLNAIMNTVMPAFNFIDLAAFNGATTALNLNGLTGRGYQVTYSSPANGSQFTATLGNNNASGAFSGAIVDKAATVSFNGQLGVVKVGTGTQYLFGNNSYTGGTNVSQGTLVLGGNSPSPVTVAAGATLAVGGQGLLGEYYNVSAMYLGTGIANAQFSTLTTLNAHFAALAGTNSLALAANSAKTGVGGAFDFKTDGSSMPQPYTRSAANFEARYTGKFLATTAGSYIFQTSSDDDSALWIDGTKVVDIAWSHGVTTVSGAITLSPGLHDITIAYADGTGGYGLTADVQTPGGIMQRLSNSLLFGMGGATANIGSLSGPAGSTVALYDGQLNVNQTADGTFAGTISGVGGSLVKTGVASLLLSGNNSYTGGTTVASGTLQLGSATALGPNGGNLTLNGALDLGGNSLVVGDLTGATGQVTNTAAGDLTLTLNPRLTGTYAGQLSNGPGRRYTGAGDERSRHDQSHGCQ